MAKLHPLLKSKLDALGNEAHRRLFERVARTSVPIFWHGPTEDDAAIYNNGSLCLVDTGERVIGVTARHVHQAYVAQRLIQERLVCQFGSITVVPEQLLIDQNEKLDLATYDLSPILPHLESYEAHRPTNWPPPRPSAEDLVIYGGFPGSERRADVRSASFSLDTITGMVSEVTPTSLVIGVNYGRLLDAEALEGNVVVTDAPGTSGGPVYRITDAPGLAIIGFITEQSQSYQVLIARHADVIKSDGTIAL